MKTLIITGYVCSMTVGVVLTRRVVYRVCSEFSTTLELGMSEVNATARGDLNSRYSCCHVNSHTTPSYINNVYTPPTYSVH